MSARATPLLRSSLPLPHAPQRRESSPSPPRTRRAQAWLALHLRDWPLHAAFDRLPSERRAQLERQPAAVLADDRQRRVLACNAAALRRGIRPGHTLNAAVVLCADIHLLPRDLHHEARLLERLANWAQQYTPAVSLEPPNELLLEVRGSLRLFGGPTALVEKIRDALHAQRIDAGLCLSATPRSALWLARTHPSHCIAPPARLKSSLAALPVQSLCWAPEVELRLARFGVQAVGDLLRLPRADLARRIGAACARELDCALGRRREIRALHRPPPCYEDHVLLDFEVETTGMLAPILERPLEYLRDHLQSHALALSRLRIELIHREQKMTPLQIGLAAPTADMQHVARLLDERLAQLVLPAPVLELRLRVQRLFAAQGRSAHLFKKGEGEPLGREEQVQRLLEQLRARLGDDAVIGLRLHADHRPEKTQVEARAAVSTAVPISLPSMPLRPLWLLPEPQTLNVGSQPAEMRLLRGPERIAAGWWDGEPVARDYYVAQGARGTLCWVFCEGGNKTRWYLHGWFG